MKRIKRLHHDRVIAGVCSGFGDYFNLDPALIRLVWIFFTLFGGSGILAYIIAMIIIPDEYSHEEAKPSGMPKKNTYATTFWGIILVVVGLVLFMQHGHLIGVFFHSFWGAGINVVLAIALIIIGGYLIYSKKTDIQSIFNSKYTDKLHISENDKKVLGVCGGIAETLMIDSTLVRFLWVFITFMSVGAGILLYILLAFILPKHSVENEDSV